MSKTYDELMKVLEDKGAIPDDVAQKLIKEHGPLDDEEKKKVASAIKMKKALTTGDDKDKAESKEKPGEEEATMDAYLQALSVLDSDAASKEDKEKAQKIKDKFESQ